MTAEGDSVPAGRVAELFAGVGGFRLALEGHSPSRLRGSGWKVVWSNQWEPSTQIQHASECYKTHFGSEGHVCEDIHNVLAGRNRKLIPPIDMLVGGFPCQDYSVARVLSQAAGIEGKKGVLWWEIEKFLHLKKPRFVFLENVDRLLKSPANQRGRDFGMILRCLADLNYMVEWRVINAADYGAAQRRRRVYIVGEKRRSRRRFSDPVGYLEREGALANALSCRVAGPIPLHPVAIPKNRLMLSERFSAAFENAGVMSQGSAWTMRVTPHPRSKPKAIGTILQDEHDVPEDFFIPEQQLSAWRKLKGAKKEPRKTRDGFEYTYAEGSIAFPDPVDQPSRTILTGEGGATPSRFKHVIQTPTGRWRRLTPIELEKLNEFPPEWTNTGMPPGRRAFCMGNALVVGPIRKIGRELASRLAASPSQAVTRAKKTRTTTARRRSAER